MSLEVVRDIRTLRSMEKHGLITLHHQTGKEVTWYGQSVGKAWYIDDYAQPSFMHGNQQYYIKYFDGCFCPYVIKDN